jgi:pilus assembly protein Flp/PilA
MAEPSCDRSGAATERSRIRSTGPFLRFARDANGSTAMEYAMIGALIFVVAAGSIRYYGSRMIPIYNQISSAVTQAE